MAEWWQLIIEEETGYCNFPEHASKTRNGRILDRPICYYKKEEREWRAKIRSIIQAIWSGKDPLTGAIETLYFFGIKIPASWSKKKRQKALDGIIKPQTKPDITNRLYWLENRLKGIVFEDDAQVCGLAARAKYVEEPFTEVFVRQLGEECH